ncbi:MAG TPA: 2-dehydropantoate 2-reductase N-terminal domain-containing protein [Thermoanaerobaculia bacterium]|nr:2-dehydropantoate 2-reductase N-terminal domain-containing protein [Thermoanaerobaculia bacterium]
MFTSLLSAALSRARLTEELSALPPETGLLEVPDGVDPELVRSHFRGPLIFTTDERGPARRERLIEASAKFDFVMLDKSDVTAAVLRAIPPERRILAWRGRVYSLAEMRERLYQVTFTPARWYRLEAEVRKSGEELFPLQLLHECGRDDVAAYATGAVGFWTRILSPFLGAPFVRGTLTRSDEAGVPTAEQLTTDYGLPHRRDVRQIFGIVGSPVLQSLSPRLHNAAFEAIGRPALYLPFHADRFDLFWMNVVEPRAIEGLGFDTGAFCVVSPHKEVALAATKQRTRIVERARSTNFFIREGDQWTADTTDPEGVLVTLRERGIDPGQHRIAVIGCGGSGRAVAAALQQAGADVTMVNRGFDRATLALHLLKLPFRPLAGFSAGGFSVIVNATPVGRDGTATPFDMDDLHASAVVVDFAYGEGATPLVTTSRERGQLTIDGRDVLMTQAMTQFRLMTGQEMPAAVTRRILGREPAASVALSA